LPATVNKTYMNAGYIYEYILSPERMSLDLKMYENSAVDNVKNTM